MGFYQDYSEHGMCLRTEQPVVSSYVFVYSIDRETTLPQKKSDTRFYTKAAIYGSIDDKNCKSAILSL